MRTSKLDLAFSGSYLVTLALLLLFGMAWAFGNRDLSNAFGAVAAGWTWLVSVPLGLTAVRRDKRR